MASLSMKEILEYARNGVLAFNGMLGYNNSDNIGKTISIPKLATSAIGNDFVSDPFSVLKGINEQRSFNPENASLLAQSVQLDFLSTGNTDFYMVQGLLRMAVGSAQFGYQQDPAVNAGLGNVATQLIFDIQNGVSLTLPALTSTDFAVRVVAASSAGFGGDQTPAFRINAGLSYGTTDRFGFLTKTDVSGVDLPAAGVRIVPKPLFAESLQILWGNASTIGPMSVIFIGPQATSIVYATSIAAGTVVPPQIPWPAGAWAVKLVNGHGATAMKLVQVVSRLAL